MKKVELAIIDDLHLKDLATEESQKLSLLDHPCIIDFYDVFQIKNDLYIVMQFANYGDLQNLIDIHVK